MCLHFSSDRYTTLQLLGTWRLQRHIQPRIDQLEHSGNLASESIEEEEVNFKIRKYLFRSGLDPWFKQQLL